MALIHSFFLRMYIFFLSVDRKWVGRLEKHQQLFNSLGIFNFNMYKHAIILYTIFFLQTITTLLSNMNNYN